MITTKVSEFLPFKPLPNAAIIAASLKEIPSHWSLTPLQGKKPFRKGWQSEPFIPHGKIADLIINGEEAISKEGKPYRRFWSGFGLRLGEASLGLLAVDVDGSSARPILEAMVGVIPQTIGWTSGKAGRRQLLFQVPDNLRDSLKISLEPLSPNGVNSKRLRANYWSSAITDANRLYLLASIPIRWV
jgi:hypothetical protein